MINDKFKSFLAVTNVLEPISCDIVMLDKKNRAGILLAGENGKFLKHQATLEKVRYGKPKDIKINYSFYSKVEIPIYTKFALNQ